MGTSTNAILAYGYNLGPEESLKVREAQESETNPYGYLKTSWYDAENDDLDEDSPSIVEMMTKVLYDAIPDAPVVERDWDREGPVKEHYGVWFESHCHVDYPMWILTTSVTTAYRGDALTVDPVALSTDPEARGWDAKLAEALRVLGITPLQESPAWLLASDWG